MTDEPNPLLIEEPQESTKNNFPILAQLSILGLIVAGIFSAFIFQGRLNSEDLQEAAVPASTETEVPTSSGVPQKLGEIEVRARAAYVWDVSAQRVLYSKNADEVLPLASITKLMTTLLAYELIDETEKTAVPLSAVQQEGSSGLAAGERFDIRSLRKLALISSSNDAAYTLAASVGGLLGNEDSANQFVQGMNIRAKELELSSLQFKNPTGLDLSSSEPGAVGSARDVSFLLEYMITTYPDILSPTKISATRVYNTDGAYHEAENTNDYIGMIPGLIASKTGYTNLAGGNLTIAFDLGYNHPVIVTVLGSTYDERFSDVLTLTKAVRESVITNQ